MNDSELSSLSPEDRAYLEEVVADRGTSGLPADAMPHQFLAKIALDDNYEVADGYALVNGVRKVVYRTWTPAERLSAAKAAAPYYAPLLKAIEVVNREDPSRKTTEQIEAELLAMVEASKKPAEEIQA